jgi:NADH-quinone oxidoreductase subunit L
MLGPLMILAIGAIFAGLLLYKPFVGSASHGDETHAVQTEQAEVNAEDVHAKPSQPHAAEKKFAQDRHTFWGDSIKVLPQNDTVEAAHHVPKWVKYLPLGMGLLGIALAYLAYMYRTTLPQWIMTRFKALHLLFYNKWFFDGLYALIFVKGAYALGCLFWRGGDQNIIDRFGPDGSAKVTQKIAALASRFQSGFVFQYAFVMMIAVIAMMSWFVFKIGNGLG